MAIPITAEDWGPNSRAAETIGEAIPQDLQARYNEICRTVRTHTTDNMRQAQDMFALRTMGDPAAAFTELFKIWIAKDPTIEAEIGDPKKYARTLTDWLALNASQIERGGI